MVGERLTGIAGSSDVYLGGIVAYSNTVKAEQLGVAVEVLEQEGAVSAAAGEAMAHGARLRLASRPGASP